MNSTCRHALLLSLGLCTLPALAADSPLIVVRDRGGSSALPYYRALSLQAHTPQETAKQPALHIPTPAGQGSEADLLPVHSARLTPGPVEPRVIRAPGLTPIFLIGDDSPSRTWLQQKHETLRALHAVGLVVHVDSLNALESLRKLAPGVTLAPASGDDLAGRLGLRHYPVLITATGIEQ